MPGFILVTFATNATPGGGAANDEVLIDDISLVYTGGVGLDEASIAPMHANYSNQELSLFGQTQGTLMVYAMNGAEVFNGLTNGKTTISLTGGVYVARLIDQNGNIFSTKFSVN